MIIRVHVYGNKYKGCKLGSVRCRKDPNQDRTNKVTNGKGARPCPTGVIS